MEIAPWHTILFFLANSLYILAYMVTNIIWLRIITVIAATITLPYFFFQDEPLWSAVFWQLMFAGVNIVNLLLLYIKSLPIKLTPFEEQIRTLVFRTLSISDLRKMLKEAHTKTFAAGEAILSQGQTNGNLYVLLQGGCRVNKGDKYIAHLLPGQFAGEISFLTDKTVSANVIADRTTEVAYWTNESLEKLFKKNSSLQKYMVTLLGQDLAAKLSTT